MLKVIGLVGPMASGKGLVADYLVSQGYTYFRLSDVIKEEITKRKLPTDRKTFQDLGNELRKNFGSDILVKRIFEKNPEGKIVLDGIRNPGEVKYLKTTLQAEIIGINATPEKRYQFVQARKRSMDPKTWEEFFNCRTPRFGNRGRFRRPASFGMV